MVIDTKNKMLLSLIICTYQRPKPIIELLESINTQIETPDEVIVVDGSLDSATLQALKGFKPNGFDFQYFRVNKTYRGLTKQRNFGISKLRIDSKIVTFLDDDVILEPTYFQEVKLSFEKNNVLGVGGFVTNDAMWQKTTENHSHDANYWVWDGFKRLDSARFRIRKAFGLLENIQPGIIPVYSHGRSLSFLPPSGKEYQVEQLIGCNMSFRKLVFDEINFSTYFEGYGLYEDFDFSVRASKFGVLLLNTRAKLAHYHAPSGRPNHFKYGKMVMRNGWYVWRVKFSNPAMSSRLKWNATAFLLTIIRLTNGSQSACLEALGRIWGWISLVFNKPKITH